MEIDEHIFELFKQSNELRSQTIWNFDSQVVRVREIFAGIVAALVGTASVVQKENLLLVISVLSVLFWIIETSVKYNQRGYVLVASEIQKKMLEAKDEAETAEVIKKYHSDMNGFYSIRKRDKKWYSRMTGFWHTMFMPNVRALYICVFAVSLLVFVLFKVL